MPTQRAVPSAPAACLGLALAAAILAAACADPPPVVLASKTAPDAHHVATVRLVPCDKAWCESLWVGASPDSQRRIVTLAAEWERCTEIAWTRDGKRVAFLINGTQLRLYHAETYAPAGQVDLVPNDSHPTTRVARGVTFSENGAALTFDDCPRDRSGCRPGMIAIR